MDKTLLVTCLVLATVVVVQGRIPDDIRNQIRDQRANVEKILHYFESGQPGYHQAFDRLAFFTDKYGHRNTGTQALEDVIDYLIAQLNDEQFNNVAGETVTAPKWVRGSDTVEMLLPRPLPMDLLALGGSVGTANPIEADVIVVESFDELEQKKNEVSDKIVVYNMEWVDYGTTVKYRNEGACRASKLGAVAMLLRSVTDFSLYTPHTGQQYYDLDGVPCHPIPAIAITVEDAELMHRMYKRNENITVKMDIGSGTQGNITTRNVVAQLTGSQFSTQTVSFGGHIDSWDIGAGVMDDGGGVVISWQVLTTLKALGITPRRTMRSIFWTAEEIGLVGSEQYYERHKDENADMSLIMESDGGTFEPRGVGFTGADLARAILEEIVEEYLGDINAVEIGPSGDQPDTGMWIEQGVPGASLYNRNENYFWYHHTKADSITMQDPDVLDRCAMVWTVVSYVVAQLDEKLPRTGNRVSAGDPLVATAGFAAYTAVALAGLKLATYR